MAAHLTRFSKKTKVIGLVGFGSGGPDGWRKEWRDKTGAEKYAEKPIDHVSRAVAGFIQRVRLCRSGRSNALGRRRRLHPFGQPAALTDEDQLMRQPAQRSRRNLGGIPEAHRAPARGVFRSSAGSRSKLVENDPRSSWSPARTTRATGSTTAPRWKTSVKCSWARNTPPPRAALMSF